ncbi:uncharacterized protein LOC134210622 [Armigeres subalbatus]|uniref:uncharacterized protein LOC134210622 n=1 Tax=Armigeres subalbatus TaxID=124917 RepID=UPI002ED15C27
MSDQDIKVQTFNDLRLAGDQLDQIPLKKVSRISLNSLRRQDSDIEVYEFILGQIVHRYAPNDFEAEVSAVLLPELLKHLDKIVIELKDNALSCFLIDNLKSFLSFANILLNFAEYVYQVSEAYQLYKTTTIFLEFLVRSYGIVCRSKATANRDSNEQDIVQQIFTICQRIQLMVVHLLAPSDKASPYFQQIGVEEQFQCLQDVIVTLCKIGSLTVRLDNIRCTEAWKAVGKLCSLHEGAIKTTDTAWLHPLIFKIDNEIESAFKMLLENKAFTKNDVVKLKLINLMLRVLIKILQFINTDEFDEYHSILKTIVTVEDALQSRGIDLELAEAIRQYLLVGYMNVIGLVFRSKSFAKALTSTNYQSTEEIAAFYNIIIQVLSKVLSESRNINIVELYVVDCRFLENCIGYICKSHRLFNQDSSLYRKLLVHLSAFVLMCSKYVEKKHQKMIEETLVHMILHESYWVKLLGLDIWSIYLRYNSVELLWQYLNFWKAINDRFPVVVAQPKVIFVRRLIHNIFLFMPNSMQQKVLIEYPIMVDSNHKLWIAIGIQSVEKHLTMKTKQSLQQLMKQNCSILLKKPTVDMFYRSLDVMYLISSCRDKDILQAIEPDIIVLWNRLKLNDRWTAKSDSLIQALVVIVVRLAELQICSKGLSTAVFEKTYNNLFMLSDSLKLKLIELACIIVDNAEQILPLLAADRNDLVKETALFNLEQLQQSRKACVDFNETISSALAKLNKDLNKSNRGFKQTHSNFDSSEHRCYKECEAVQITQHISDRIDELFPDDDDDAFQVSLEKVTRSEEASPSVKRIRLSCSKSVPDVGALNQSAHGVSGAANEAICEIKKQLNILQQLYKLKKLSGSELMEIRKLGDSLTLLEEK